VTAAHCNILQHTVTHCNTIEKFLIVISLFILLHDHTEISWCHRVVKWNSRCRSRNSQQSSRYSFYYDTERFFSSRLQHTATHCNILQHTVTHTVTHCHTIEKFSTFISLFILLYEMPPRDPGQAQKSRQ